MPLLPSITSPADLRDLSADQLPTLAGEIRDFLVHACARTGGHLGPNLGAVELTMALHRVFDSPREPILFDTGHQAYVHKLLTGRQDFTELRRAGGLSGYPSRAESEHDWIENSHASTALSYADGLAKAMAVRGESRPVVAVVGDGALTGGMCWEALNNIAGAKDRPVIVVVNDNGRSYSPTIGGLADSLATLRLRPGYENFLDSVKSALSRTPIVGNAVYDALHGMKKGLKDVVAPQGMFEDLGMKYVGPVDGHDLDALQSAFLRAKDFGAPVIVHCVTTKGFGYQPAESDEEDAWHSRGAFDPTDGSSTSAAAPTWTEAFSAELVRLGGTRPDLVAITAAMLHPTGLAAFAEKFPARTYDVGIAEQHAVASAAGLAMGGLHPVVAIYATFLNRAFDQVLLDVAMHRLPVTFVLDRAGVTGEDGASHNGMWDLSVLGIVPGLRIAVPRDAPRLRTALGAAVAESQAPTALRFPKGAVVIDQDPVRTIETASGTGLDVLAEPDSAPDVDILIVALGPLCAPASAAAAELAESGLRVRVIDPVWIRPVPPELIEATRTAGLVVTVEDGGRTGGFGSWVAEAMRDAESPAELSTLGLDQEFLAVGARTALLAAAGLDAQGLVASISTRWQRLADRTQPGAEATAERGTVVDLTRTDPHSRDPRRRSASS